MPTPSIDAIPTRTTLHQEVLRHITDRILDGTLEPGERLSDVELSSWLGVSRTPIREALMVLSARGLVETQPNRYTRVTEIDLEAFRHRQIVLARLVELAAQLAIENSDRHTRAALAAATRRTAESFTIEAPGDGADALCSMIAQLAQASENLVLRAKLDECIPCAQRTYRIIWANLAFHKLREAWERLADFIYSGDSFGAAATVRHNIAPVMLQAVDSTSLK